MIGDIRLQHFRSYNDESFEFDDSVNIVMGPNGSGKTNLLEAILVLCKGSSYRAGDKDLLTHEADWARLDGQVHNMPRSVIWQSVGDILTKEYRIGGNSLKRLSHQRTVPVVLFEPSHLRLLTDSPSLRRDFLDDIIEGINPGYGATRRHYKRILAQRNSLLKQPSPSSDLFVWDVRLSELGGRIMQERRQFIEAHQKQLADLYSKLAGKKHSVSLGYYSRLTGNDPTSSLLKALQKNLATDKERGFTGFGPHRDDVVPILDDYPLSASGSRGETRSMLLAMKLLELQVLEQARGQKPILLLDDVFSELDGARRRALTDHLKDHQTFITTTDADIVVQHFMDKCRVIPMGA